MTARPALRLAAALLVLTAPVLAAPRVIIISVDGLRPDVISAETTPHIAALRAAGAQARRAVNDLPSATLPNHATMLTGLVSQRHGVILDFELEGTIPHATIFDHAAEAGLRCAFLASKTKLSYLAPPESLAFIDTTEGPAGMVELLLPLLSPDGPDLIFAHFKDPDSTGHRFGWLSPEYLEATRAMDGLIGRVLEAVRADTTRETYVLITADHGGLGTNHFLNVPENRLIPWIVAGPGIPPASTLDEDVSIADTAPTVLWLLGVEIPANLSGRARTALIPPTGREDSDIAAGLEWLAVPAIGPPCVVLALPVIMLLTAAVRLLPTGRRLPPEGSPPPGRPADRRTSGPRRSPRRA
jgi:predicted AlkP superfamily pyrophosphatase or phosphodiesterase